MKPIPVEIFIQTPDNTKNPRDWKDKVHEVLKDNKIEGFTPKHGYVTQWWMRIMGEFQYPPSYSDIEAEIVNRISVAVWSYCEQFTMVYVDTIRILEDTIQKRTYLRSIEDYEIMMRYDTEADEPCHTPIKQSG